MDSHATDLLRKIAYLEKENSAIERRAQQDVRMVQGELKSAIATFSHKVWRRIEDSFTEMQRMSTRDLGNKSPDAKIPYMRLMNIYSELKSLGIAR